MKFLKNKEPPTYEQVIKKWKKYKEPLLKENKDGLPTYEQVLIEERKKQKAKQKLIDVMNKANSGKKVDWFYISEKCPLTEDFIRRHKTNLVWYDVKRRYGAILSYEFRQEFRDILRRTRI